MTAGLVAAPPLLLLGAAYVAGVRRLRRRGDRWSVLRTAYGAAGLIGVAAAVLPPVAAYDEWFPVHVVAHLLLASLAPLLLALAAPVTLALRTLPRRPRRMLLRALHGRLARVVTRPGVLLPLAVAPLYLLYATPLFALTERYPALHAAVHAHMLVAGCLLSWYLVGTDPMSRRDRVRTRLLVLVAVAGAHDVLATLMYAHGWPPGGGPVGERRLGAQLMFYGGDVVEVLLAVALLAQWYARTGRELARVARREAVARPPELSPTPGAPSRR